MIKRILSRSFGWMLAAFAGIAFAGLAHAAPVLSSFQGDVRTSTDGSPVHAATANEQLAPGTIVTTGADARAIIKFDDGQIVVLDQFTNFRLAQFRYDAARPEAGLVGLDLLKGALRAITGLIGRSNHAAFALRVPQATIGVRGTDFMVALVNPAYVSVLDGSVAATNNAGTAVFGTGSLGSISSVDALGASIPGSALPAPAAGAFSRLASVPGLAVGGPAGGAGGGGTAGASGGTSTGAIAAGVIGAALIGAAAAGGGGGGSSTTHH